MRYSTELFEFMWGMRSRYGLHEDHIVEYLAEQCFLSPKAVREVVDKKLKEELKEEQKVSSTVTGSEEVLRQSMINRALDTGDKDLFLKLTSSGWEQYVFTPEDELDNPVIVRRIEAKENGETLLPWQEQAVTRKNTGIHASPTAPKAVEPKVETPTPKNSVKDCPICGGQMVKRNGRYGDFYGCCDYPSCRGTRKA